MPLPSSMKTHLARILIVIGIFFAINSTRAHAIVPGNVNCDALMICPEIACSAEDGPCPPCQPVQCGPKPPVSITNAPTAIPTQTVPTNTPVPPTATPTQKLEQTQINQLQQTPTPTNVLSNDEEKNPSKPTDIPPTKPDHPEKCKASWCTPTSTPTVTITPKPTTTITPYPTCIPEPPCLHTKPQCYIAVPEGGWCPQPQPIGIPFFTPIIDFFKSLFHLS